MSLLEKIKKAESLADLAKLLGFKPSGLNCILYKTPEDEKYHYFERLKKSGGVRSIHAPEKPLALLKSRLAKLLYECVKEHKKNHPRFWFTSHGFHKGRTILSNAEKHKKALLCLQSRSGRFLRFHQFRADTRLFYHR